MPIDYLDPRRSGDLEYQRGLRTAALDRELQYDIPAYNGNVAKMQARGLQYGRDRQRLNSQLDSGGFDPLYAINAQSAQIQHDTPTEFDQPGGGGSATAQPFRGGWDFGPRPPKQLSPDALAFSDRLAQDATARQRGGFIAAPARQPDYLEPRSNARHQPALDAGPTDDDLAMQQQRYYGRVLTGASDPYADTRKQAADRRTVQTARQQAVGAF